MSSIYHFNANDFGRAGQQKQHLAINVGGITLIMFHSTKCSHCVSFMPQYSYLPSMIRGVNFALCNLDDNNKIIIDNSTTSTTPIKSVPKFILYNNGIPISEYTGARTVDGIMAFLQDILSQLGPQQPFVRTRQNSQPTPPSQQPGGMPQRPGTSSNYPQQRQPPAPEKKNYEIAPSSGVKIYETSYGRPYNAGNEKEFLAYEKAYLEQKTGKR